MVYFGGDSKGEQDPRRLTEVGIVLSSENNQENMLEEQSFLVSRRFSRSCDRENSWDCMNYRMEKIEIQHGKRLLESNEDDEVGARKLPKQLDAYNSLDLASTTQEVSMIPVDQSGNQRHAGDNSDTSSLIHSIGRDNSISALIRSSRSDYGALASLNKSFRELIRSGELYRLRRQNGVIEHWVYFSCQLLGWEAFDPTSRRWMRLPTMTSDECFMFSDKESLAVGTELLVFGKVFSSLFIFKYSLLTNTWSSGMKMNFPRCLFGSASVGEIAILAGGCDLSGNALSVAELYNSELGTWEALPNMNKTRKMCSAVFMDGKFYVIGGIGGSDSKLLTCGEEYDLQTRIWTEIPNMSPARTRPDGEIGMPVTADAPPLVAVVDNELYAANYAEMEVRKYDKNRRIWETVGRLPERADSMNGWGLAFRACGDRLIVIGGPRAAGEGFIEINAWAPKDGPPQWNLLGRKQCGSFVYNCAVMGC
ncbi:F-box/kelch-repeat protein At1g26930 [Daucus carota subsp. sativus]|uniref:F-box domain-containing protein n=2 Tax=Daucus carota subsp. sativus TaxID=79200 RepID=A0A166EAL0_DAUCS|nr:PREDICTED: F-box/kelch-repeat protein At1g26930-like [Daucus carota subsp. sativus]